MIRTLLAVIYFLTGVMGAMSAILVVWGLALLALGHGRV